MQELEKILEEIEQRVNYYKENATLEYVDICAGLREAEGIIRKHISGKDINVPTNNGWIPVEKYGLPKEEGIYDLTIINGRGEYVSVRWEFLSGVHLSGHQHYVDGVHYWADNYRGEPINEFLSERVIAWRKKPEPYYTFAIKRELTE